MLILKVLCNILNYAQPGGSRASYVQILHYVQFRTDCRKSLCTFSCDVCTNTVGNLLFRGILTYQLIFSNINIFMTGWKNICSTYESWNLQQWFSFIFLCVFQLQNLFSIHLSFLSEVYLLLYKKIITTIFISKDELICYLLDKFLDR